MDNSSRSGIVHAQKKKKYEELEEKNSTKGQDTRGGYKTVYDQFCLGWRKVFAEVH